MTEIKELYVSVSVDETLLSYLGVILEKKLHFADKGGRCSGMAGDCRRVFLDFALPPGPAGYRH